MNNTAATAVMSLHWARPPACRRGSEGEPWQKIESGIPAGAGMGLQLVMEKANPKWGGLCKGWGREDPCERLKEAVFRITRVSSIMMRNKT